MKVNELVDILRLADPEAEVFGEFEGDFYPTAADDVRVGRVTLLQSSNYSDGRPMESKWCQEKYAEVLARPVIRTCEGILLWAGQSDSEWPERLSKRKI